MLLLPEFGYVALSLAVCVGVATALLTFSGYSLRWSGTYRLARCWTLVLFGLVLFAFIALTLSVVQDDFSVNYVAQHSHRDLPLGLKIAAVWGGHEGSLLLWLLCLTGWSTAFACRYRKAASDLFPLTLAMLAVIASALLVFILFFSDPFLRLFPPAVAGRDLNPMLQHIGLILHPPLLYLGYGGLTVSAALALAALIHGEFTASAAWICWRWALPAWSLLTLGIILGSWWAYNELGWGGWWFWDPVENASLLPWLTASALLHSLSVTRMRGIFRHWSLILALLTFILCLLGTLIVRSGILVSVHAFALEHDRAVPLFILFACLSMAALAVYGWRAQLVHSAARFSGWSREMMILLALLLFSAVALVVLLGTLYPMIYGLAGWGKISVGAPYFNRVLLPFGVLMLLLIGGAAGGYWKRSARWPVRRVDVTLAVGAIITLVLWPHGYAVALAAGPIGWVMAAQWLQPLSAIRQQLPALLAHTGVALFALGIAFSAGSKQEISANVGQGEQVTLGDYHFRFLQLELVAAQNYTTEQAVIAISRGDSPIAQVRPERRYYNARKQQMIEPGIAWGPIREWYAVMGEKTGENRYAMRFYVQSGVRWVWGGGMLMVAGALLGWFRGRRAYD
ncbi:heme lyase CcmF/NrfE family subunit [Pectobacterium actinidiae]|uniref:heme lyase CcmF/NrfE family subunit n=1 Tax=Pectobacterium actinidiae TaxID=1507808 RepID=UPI002A7F3CBE|nr:heme lyase CcmF/NrfE family subunit [Pectobacterium actinidiae]MDY4313426.1 heme lyase CcmF/NrfE family subunit [Pectobacterium actinidiae]